MQSKSTFVYTGMLITALFLSATILMGTGNIPLPERNPYPTSNHQVKRDKEGTQAKFDKQLELINAILKLTEAVKQFNQISTELTDAINSLDTSLDK